MTPTIDDRWKAIETAIRVGGIDPVGMAGKILGFVFPDAAKVKKLESNRGQFWTPERVALLKEMRLNGAGLTQIRSALNDLPGAPLKNGAISKKMSRLNLPTVATEEQMAIVKAMNEARLDRKSP